MAQPGRFWRLAWAVAIAWWVVSAAFEIGLRFVYPETRLTLFVDARLYRLASLAWLQGGDPWGDLGLHRFAAPPPSLVFMAPFALVPEAVAIPIYMGLSLVAVAFAIRRLQLPWIFLLWPPVFNALVVGNSNAMLVALLLTRAAPVAAFAKLYAVIPLIGELRWRALAVTAALLVLTIPILPWATYLAELPAITRTLAAQAQNLSAWGTPLMLAVVPALLLLGRREGGWLAVPAAWPLTQIGYHAIALPVMRNPLMALALSVPVPLVAPLAIVAYAAVRTIQGRRSPGTATEDDGDGPATTRWLGRWRRRLPAAGPRADRTEADDPG